MEQQQVWPKQPQFFEPSDVAHAVLQMRGDGFVAILTGVADDADTALLSKLSQSAQQVVRHCDRYADREPGLQAAVQCAFELGDNLVRANERLVGWLEEALRKAAHRRLSHVEHRAGDHPAHTTLFDGLCCLGAEVAARIGKARGPGADHLKLSKPSRAKRIAFVHVSLDWPQPAE